MGVLVKSGAVLAMLAMGTAAVPAEAQWRRPPRHRGGDRIDGGDVLLGAVLAGGLIALISSANRRQAPPPPPADPAFDNGDAGPASGPGMDGDKNAAIDACVAAAEQEGRRFARVSKIDAVTAVDPDRDGWYVRGTISLRNSYSEPRGTTKAFRCQASDGRVKNVMFDGERIAAN